MLLEGALRLGDTIGTSAASSVASEAIMRKAKIQNPIARLIGSIGISSVLESALSAITKPVKAAMGIDKEMVAHSKAGKTFKKAIDIAGIALPFVMSDMKMIRKFWPVAATLGGGLLLYGAHASGKENEEKKRLGLLNNHGKSLEKIAAG